MAKQKLIPEPPETETTGPRARFREMGTSVFSVPKSEIDERERDSLDWKSRTSCLCNTAFHRSVKMPHCFRLAM